MKTTEEKEKMNHSQHNTHTTKGDGEKERRKIGRGFLQGHSTENTPGADPFDGRHSSKLRGKGK